MRRLAVPLLIAAVFAGSASTADDVVAAPAALPSDGELLAAARSADVSYQVHLAALGRQTEASDQAQRIAAYLALGRLQDPQALAIILVRLDGSPAGPGELAAMANALGLSGNPAAIPALRKLSVSGGADVRLAAYNALGDLESASPADHVQRAKDADPRPHLAALTNLATLKQADAAPLLVAGLTRHPRALLRRQCAIGLGRLGDPVNGPVLQTALSDPDPGVRRYAAEAIATIDYRPAIPFLLMALDANIAAAHINGVVKRMTGEDFGFDPSSDALKRKEAIEHGFAWWTAHASDS